MSIPVMSAGGDAGLFKLAENAALDENRVMPSERTYPKSSTTVSINEAIALMKKRKSNPSLRIKGGIDDTSDAVRKNPKKLKAAVVEQPLVSEDTEQVETPREPQPLEVGKVADQPKKRGRKANPELTVFMSDLKTWLAKIDKTLDVLYTSTKDNSAEVSPADTLGAFKSNSHTVTFMLRGMEFTVKCLNMVKDVSSHTIVFVFPDDSESFFIPPTQSELKVKYDGLEEPGQLYYFGMCFSLKQLGLKFLGFIYDDKVNQ